MIADMLKNILHRCWDSTLFLSGEGNWKLRDLEKRVLEAVKNYIEKDDSNLLEAQLGQKFFIQRMNSSRVNSVFFYGNDESNRILGNRFDDILFKVRLTVGGKKETAHVTFFEGYIHSIEFKKPKKYYQGKNIKVGSVSPGESDRSHASAIDRLEHGGDAQNGRNA